MQEELFLNGLKVDLPEKKVTLNLQANDLGEMKDRQSDFMPKFELDLTPRNIAVMEYLGVVGNQSSVPYRNLPAKFVLEGVELIPEGRAVVKAIVDKKEVLKYQVHVYSGNIEFFDAIEGKNLRDLDFSDIDHKLTYALMIESFSQTKDYIYAVAGYAGKIPVQNNFDLRYMMPSIYFHALWSRIWSEAGYEYEGDIFSDPEFTEIIAGATGFDKGQTNFLQKDFRHIVPDMSQKDFVKEVLWRYGLIPKKVRNERKYIFKQLKDILKDKANAVDYSENYISSKKTSFRLNGYNRQNWIRYAETNDGTTNQDGLLEVDIENLGGSKDMIKSAFSALVDVTPFKYVELNLFEIDTENDDIKITQQKPWVARVKFIADSNNFLDEDQNFQTYSGSKPFARFENLSFRREIYFNYREVREVISKAEVREVLIRLNPIEAYQFDVQRLMYFEQLSAFYYANKIKGINSDKYAVAEVVKIPSSVFEIGADTTAPIVDLSVDDDTPDSGQVSVFTLSVTEENIDTWVLDFGYASEQVSGVGIPPTNISHSYPTGTYTATLTVTDFEGNQASDSVVMTVAAVDNMQINDTNGEITAPAGSTINFKLTISGDGTLSGFAGVAETFGGGSTLASGQVDNDTVNADFDQIYETSFVMPASGSAFLTGSCSPIGGGSTGGALVIELKLNSEIETRIVNLNETYP